MHAHEGRRATLNVAGERFEICPLDGSSGAENLPVTLKILLENVLRHADASEWDMLRSRFTSRERADVPFHPARVLMQDFTGVPCLVDLAAMRDAVAARGLEPGRVNPSISVDLVIDHSVTVEEYASPAAFEDNVSVEFRRNQERYRFLKWGQQAFENVRIVPPGTGICHQVNLEHLATVVTARGARSQKVAFPDTCVGTDSHTTMINGLGVLGWGVGGIEAEAAMLGEPISLQVPEVLGVRLHGELGPGVTATDLVLTLAEFFRKLGVVGKLIEFFGDGLERLSVPDRATIGNMSPEFGSTCAFFPVDQATLDYLRFTGRRENAVKLVEAYTKEQGLFRSASSPVASYGARVDFDLSEVVPSVAGPRRPQDRIPLAGAKPLMDRVVVDASSQKKHLPLSGLDKSVADTFPASDPIAPAALSASSAPRRLDEVREVPADRKVMIERGASSFALNDGSVVIAAITSCTNTSNPDVMLGAGLLAQAAVKLGLTSRPWVKTSLAPGSRVVMDYLRQAGLLDSLERLGFHLVGFGCTTCIGNSGPLDSDISSAINVNELAVAAVLSGNRNFEGRIHPEVKLNFLASPPLVVAYAIAGRVNIDFENEPLGVDPEGRPIFLRSLWPTDALIESTRRLAVSQKEFSERYAVVHRGTADWEKLEGSGGATYAWDSASTYIRRPPFLETRADAPAQCKDIHGARILALLGDSVTTDHISPAGTIAPSSVAGRYLMDQGVHADELSSYGARRGNHEVMVRGTFANRRLRNAVVPEISGGFTRNFLSGNVESIYEASVAYAAAHVPLVVVAGAEYGSGSSRDWAAKGTRLLGVRAVIAESFERIHRSNLVQMGVLPLEVSSKGSLSALQLRGDEAIDIVGLAALEREVPKALTMQVHGAGASHELRVRPRIDTAAELSYFTRGGILPALMSDLTG